MTATTCERSAHCTCDVQPVHVTGTACITHNGKRCVPCISDDRKLQHLDVFLCERVVLG